MRLALGNTAHPDSLASRMRRQRLSLFLDLAFWNNALTGSMTDSRVKMANAVRRVARGYHRRFNLGWLKATPAYLQAQIDVEQIRLLPIREYRLLFPDAEIRRCRA